MLSAESLAKIDFEVSKYPPEQKRSAVMGALRIAQVEKGWLAPETIEFVANYLQIAPVAAYEVATFYNMYDRKPLGKHKLTVCTNLPCALSGGVDAGKYLQQKLGITAFVVTGYMLCGAAGMVIGGRGRPMNSCSASCSPMARCKSMRALGAVWLAGNPR